MYILVSQNEKEVHTPRGSFNIMLLTTNTPRWAERKGGIAETITNFSLESVASERESMFLLDSPLLQHKLTKLTTEKRENVKSKQTSGLWRAHTLTESWHCMGKMPTLQWKRLLLSSALTLSKERPPSQCPGTSPIRADVTLLENLH